MFSFGLFSTHLPFIVIGIVSFISMAYAYFNPLAFIEKTEQSSFIHDVEIIESKTDSSIDFFEADVQFHADINHRDNKENPLPVVVSILLTKPDHPPSGEYHSFPFIARPPPLIS